MLSTVTVTFDIADLAGVDFDPRRTKVFATTNIPGNVIIDTTGNAIRLGSGNATIASDGTGSISVWAPGTGSNPDSWQTSIHVDYPDRAAQGGRGLKSFGPFTITADANLADLVAEMPVQPEYEMRVLNRIDGVTDHGNVSGAVELDSDISTHWLDATGPTVITFTDGPSGGTRYVSVLVVSGAADVTVADLPDVTLTDGAFATFAWVRGAWILAGSGGSSEPVIPDSTPPTDITDLGATGGEGTLTITGTNPADAESTARIKYRVWLTSGGATGTYVTANSFPITVTGLTAGAYTVQAYSFSNGGQQTTPDTATATVTAPAGWNTYDTLTSALIGADGNRGSTADFTTTGARTIRVASEYGNQISVVSGKIKAPKDNGGSSAKFVSDAPAAPVAIELDYDITTDSGYAPRLDINYALSAAGTGTVTVSGDGATRAVELTAYASAPVSCTAGPGKALTGGNSIQGLPVNGHLRAEVSGQLLKVFVNEALWITGDYSGVAYSGSPNTLTGALSAGTPVSFRNGAQFGDLKWETYS